MYMEQLEAMEQLKALARLELKWTGWVDIEDQISPRIMAPPL